MPPSDDLLAWLAKEMPLALGLVTQERFSQLLSEPQNVLDTVNTLYGTPHYIAPESILAAGFTVEELRLCSELEGISQGWSGTSQRPG